MFTNKRAVSIEEPRRVLFFNPFMVDNREGIQEFIDAVDCTTDTMMLIDIFGEVNPDWDFPFCNCKDGDAVLQVVREAIWNECPNADHKDMVLIHFFW